MSRLYYPEARVNLAMVKQGDDREDLLRLSAVKPISVRVESRPVNEADTFEFELEETYFPIDPRKVRTMSVGVHVGDTASLQSQLSADSAAHRMLWGFVDDIEKSHPKAGAATVKFSGRDYAAPLLDADWGTRTVALDRPIDEVVGDVIGTLPDVQQMTVTTEGFGGRAPTVEASTPKQQRYSASEGASICEALQEIAKMAGALVTVRFDEVVIRPPRTTRASDAMPLFVSGRNLEDLTIKRKFGIQDIPNVLVQAVDPSSRQPVEGQHPRPFNQTTKVSKSGDG